MQRIKRLVQAVYPNVVMNVSLVNGAAFISRLPFRIPWHCFIGKKITVSDGTNTAVGYVSAVGTGEALSAADVLSNNGFDSDTVWSKGSGWTIADGVAIKAAGSAALIAQAASIVGTLYQVKFDLVTRTAGTLAARIGTGVLGTGQTVPATYTMYLTANGTGTIGVYASATFAGTADNVYAKTVTAPDKTGCVIVSTAGGSTQNWASNSGLNAMASVFTITLTEP